MMSTHTNVQDHGSSMARIVVPLLFALLILATQLGNLEKEVIDWDESTFILMAADVLRGHLPYLHTFDSKPPVMFWALAGTMAVFGESLVTVRAFGDACLFAICVATFAIVRRGTGVAGSGLAIAVLIGVSAFEPGQHTQTEHLAMAMVMGALWLVLAHREQLWSAALAGALLSLATLTRMNLAFVVMALGVYFLAALFRPERRVHRHSIYVFVVGGLVPLGVIVAVYSANGVLETLLLSIVRVPLAYASDQMGVVSSLRAHLREWRFTTARYPWTYVPLTLLIVVGTIAFVRQSVRRPWATADEDQEDRLVILLVFGATFLSVLKSGTAYSHHWNQLFPFVSIFVAAAFASTWYHRLALWALSAVIVLAALVAFVPSTVRVLTDWREIERRYPIHQSANLIATDRRPGDTVWALDHHLVIWYLGDQPLSPVLTHPSNISRAPIFNTLVAGGYVPADELDRLVSSKPRYLVTRKGELPWYFEGATAERFERFVSANYSLWRQVGEVSIFRRKE